MYKIQSMNNNKSIRTLVFFSDFAADMGLKSILQNGLPVEPERFGQAYFENEIGYPRDADMDFSIPKSERYVMPLYDIINYFLRLDSIQPKNQLIVFTENNDHIMLKLLASFNKFYLLSKKESLQFIHHAVAEPTGIFEQHASPDIINKIGGRMENERLTHRQWFVLNQLAKSLSPAVIGGIWGLHVKTISTHKTNIMKKLGFTPWQFTQLLMKLGEVREISTVEIKTSYYHDVMPEAVALKHDHSFASAF